MSKAGLGWSNPQRGQTHTVKSVAWLHSLGPSAWWSLSCGLLVLTPTCCPSQRSSRIGWVQRDLLFWELLQIMHAPWALSLGQVAVPGWDVHLNCSKSGRTAHDVSGLCTSAWVQMPRASSRVSEAWKWKPSPQTPSGDVEKPVKQESGKLALGLGCDSFQ